MTQDPPLILESWKLGAEQFNQGEFWKAHESWEKQWKDLPKPEKEYVQALIQVCGMFFLLLEKARNQPALALCRSAQKKLSQVHSQCDIRIMLPRLEIPDLEKTLIEIEAALVRAPLDLPTSAWKVYATKLKACLITS